MKKKEKILHGMVEIAGQNIYSVQGLRLLGEEVSSVVYAKNIFNYPNDKCLNIDARKYLYYPYYICKLFLFFIVSMLKYKIYHFHFGITIFGGFDIPIYKFFKKRCYYEFHGSDLRNQNIKNRKLLRNKKICKYADGIIIHDDELIQYLPVQVNKLFVIPLRVDIEKFIPIYPNNSNDKIKIVHAPSNRNNKGTAYIIEAINNLKLKYDNIEFELVEGKTQNEAIEIYKKADIIIDQLIIGTYGVFAIESMALGKPVITYITDFMKERLPEELPLINADRDTICSCLENLIVDSEFRRKKGIEGRIYVENYHDYKIISYLLRDIYKGKGIPKQGREAFEEVKKLKSKI